MRTRRRTPAPSAVLNLTNLMDVVFAILVAFMITSPLVSRGLAVTLPQAEAPAVDSRRSVRVGIDAQRMIHLDGRPVTRQEFSAAFRSVWDGDPETPVVVEADRGVPYGLVVELLGEVRAVGVRRLAFLAAPPGTGVNP